MIYYCGPIKKTIIERLSVLIPIRSEFLIRMSRIISIQATNCAQVIIGLRKRDIASAKSKFSHCRACDS